MKTKSNLKISLTLLTLILFSVNTLLAQTSVTNIPFRTPTGADIEIRGDMQFIGNTNIGLSGFQPLVEVDIQNIEYDPNDAFNGGARNNNLTYDYIDIDSDPTTFSSSSASFTPPSACSRVVYAGLYWSSAYFLESTNLNTPTVPDNRHIQDGLPGTFRNAKIKLPGTTSYVDLTADEVIYNGYPGDPTHASTTRAAWDIPYVCYKDVTSLLSSLTNPGGEYTVANVRAATGRTLSRSTNGASSGWVLVLMYEDENLSTKRLSTKHGFLNISGVNQPFTYDGFLTLEAPTPVRANFGVATLEGDFGIRGDRLRIRRVNNTQMDLFDPVNSSTNFFNSSVSNQGAYDNTRNPNSRNTLGFDADYFSINNPSNTVIGNNQSSVRFEATTTGDVYNIFLNALSIEVVKPELRVIKRVLNSSGVDITGGGVNFGDELFYELTIQNIGNEDLTDVRINDRLPINTDLLSDSDIIVPAGVTFENTVLPNGIRRLRFLPDDSLVEENAPSFKIRFKVQVVATCADLRDACSNDIINTVRSRYEGVDTGDVVTGDESISGIDPICGTPIPGLSNFLINTDSCDNEYSAFICSGDVDLVAGTGFDNYTWTDGGGNVVQDGPSNIFTASAAGTYRVNKTSTRCISLFEEWTVDVFTAVTNPVIPIADNIRTCPINGEELPEIFLCGASDSQTIDTNFIDATSIIWERLDPTACATVTRDPDCPTIDPVCEPEWTEIATTRVHTISEEGEYRIRATFPGGCEVTFHFNVFTNNYEPELGVVREIICGNAGALEVLNAATAYEYRLILPSGTATAYQDSPLFDGLTEIGEYRLEARVRRDPPEGCIYEDRINLFGEDAAVTVTANDMSCAADSGSIVVQVTDGDINYLYTVNSTSTPFSITEGPTTQTLHTFAGLGADTYDVEVTTNDGVCVRSETVTINPAPELTINARVIEQLHCNPGFQPNPDLNDDTHPDYDPTAPPFDPNPLVALVEVTVTGGSGTYTFTSGGNVLEPVTGTTYEFRFHTDGTYTIEVQDTGATSIVCSEPIRVVIDPYTPITGTATATSPDCPGETGEITVTVAGGIPPYIYALDGVELAPMTATTYTFTGVSVGNHIVTIKDVYDCETDEINVEVIDATPITADVAITQDYTCAQEGTITITNVNGGTPAYTYSINGTDFTNTTGVFTNLTAGTYTTHVRDANGCTVTLPSLTIDPLHEITNLDFDISQMQCPALTSDLTVTATSNGAAADIRYTLTRVIPAAPALVVGPQTSNIFTGLSAGTYRIDAETITDGCSYSEQITINDIDNITISTTRTGDIVCRGGTEGEITFTAGSFDTTYSYTVTSTGTAVPPVTGTTTVPVVLSNLGAGNYIITVTDDVTNCTATETIVIDEPANDLTVTATEAGLTCVTGATITVTATGGEPVYRYELRDATNTTVIRPYQAANTFVNISDGTYTVNVEDSRGCIASTTITIDPTVDPTATIDDTLSDYCYDPTDPNAASIHVDVTDGVLPYSYQVDGGAIVTLGATQTDFTVTGLTPGTHTISVMDANSCNATDVTVTIEPAISITARLLKDLDCSATPEAQFEITNTGGYLPATLFFLEFGNPASAVPVGNFTTGVNTLTHSVATPGHYIFVVRDARGCEDFSNEFILEPLETPAATETVDDVTCPGGSDGTVVIDIDDTMGVAPFEVDFDGGGFSTNLTYRNLTAGTYTYRVRDAKECFADFTVTVGEPAAITAVQDHEPIGCGPTGDIPGSFELTNVTGGTPPYTYTLINPDNSTVQVGPTMNDFVEFLNLGFGNHRIRVEDSRGCFREFSQLIETLPIFTTSSVTTGICTDGVTIDITITGGVGPFEIREYPSGTYTAIGTPPTVVRNVSLTGLPFDTPFVYQIRDTDTGCTDIQSIAAEPSPSAMVIDVTPNLTSCNDTTDGSLDFEITNYQGTELTYEVLVANTLQDITGTVVISIPNPTTGLTGTAVTGTVTGLAPGDYLFRVIETDTALAEPCNAAETFTIDVPPVLTADLVDITPQDCNNLATAIISVVGGTPPYSYSAVPDGNPVGPFVADADGILDLDATISLNWDVYVIDANGCQAIPSPIDVGPLTLFTDPTITVPPFDICDFDDLYSFVVTATGDGPLEYSLDGINFEADINTAGDPLGSHTFRIRSSGTYTITVRDARGCFATGTITVFDPVVVDADFTIEPNCLDADGVITVTTSGGSGAALMYTLTNNRTGVVTGPQASNVFPNQEADDYTVEVFDSGIIAAGCTYTADVSRSRPTIPTVLGVDVTSPSCVGDSDGTILINIDPISEPPYTYVLTNTGTAAVVTQVDNPLFTGLPAGNYSITVTSDRGCDVTQPNIRIDDPTLLDITVSATEYSCDTSNGGVLPVITTNIIGGTNPQQIVYTTPSAATITNTIPGGATSMQLEATEAGTYTVVVTDANGCTDTENVVVNTFEIMNDPVITQNSQISCQAGDFENITVTVTGGSGNYTFTVIETGDTNTTGIFDLNAVGLYTIEVRDNDTTCTIDATYEVIPFDNITLDATVTNHLDCFGDTDGAIDLVVTGYTGNYEYIITETISGTALPTVTGTIATDPTTIPLTGLTAGSYEIRFVETSYPFCEETSAIVTIDSPTEAVTVTASLVNPESCNPGGDATIQAVASGGTGAKEFQLETIGGAVITPYSTVSTFTGLGDGSYRVRARDANNCPAEFVIDINPPALITATATASTLACFDSIDGTITVNATGGLGAGSYFYTIQEQGGPESALQQSNIFENLAPGVYTIKVTDVLNCDFFVLPAITIVRPTRVMADVVITRFPDCTNRTIDVEVTGSGGTPLAGNTYEYSIDGVNFQTSNVFLNLAEQANDEPYVFYVRDANGCISLPSNAVPVNAPDDLDVTLDMDNLEIVCFGDNSGSIDSTVQGGLGNYMYTVTGTDYLGAGVNIGPQSQSFFGELLAGTYTYTVTSGDCTPVVLPFEITQPDAAFVADATPQDITCNAEADGMITVVASGGTAPYFYSLDNNQYFEDEGDGTIGQHVFEDLTAGIYTVYVQDNNGCAFLIENIEIVEPDAIQVTLDPNNVIPETCQGDADGAVTISLEGGTPPYFVSLTGLDTDFRQVSDPTSVSFAPLAAGTVSIFIRDANDCETSYDVIIPAGPLLEANIVTELICPERDENGTVITDAMYRVTFEHSDASINSGIIYTLDDGVNPISQTSNVFTFSATSSLTFIASMEHTASSCTRILNDNVELEAYVPVAFEVVATGELNEYRIEVTGGVSAGGNYRYFVDGNELLPIGTNIFIIDETRDYEIRVLDFANNDGCELIRSIPLEFIDIQIPNYFTPDNNGEDDTWYPRELEFFPNIEVNIYDRNGRLLRTFMGPRGEGQGWDGLYNGKELPSGDYWYVIELNDRENREFTGHFTLYR